MARKVRSRQNNAKQTAKDSASGSANSSAAHADTTANRIGRLWVWGLPMAVALVFLIVTWLAQPGSFRLVILDGSSDVSLRVDCAAVALHSNPAVEDANPNAQPADHNPSRLVPGRLSLRLAASNPGLFPSQLQRAQLVSARVLPAAEIADYDYAAAAADDDDAWSAGGGSQSPSNNNNDGDDSGVEIIQNLGAGTETLIVGRFVRSAFIPLPENAPLVLVLRHGSLSPSLSSDPRTCSNPLLVTIYPSPPMIFLHLCFGSMLTPRWPCVDPRNICSCSLAHPTQPLQFEEVSLAVSPQILDTLCPPATAASSSSQKTAEVPSVGLYVNLRTSVWMRSALQPVYAQLRTQVVPELL